MSETMIKASLPCPNPRLLPPCMSPSAWVSGFSWTAQTGIQAGSDSSVYYQLVGLSESWGLCLNSNGGNSVRPSCGFAESSPVQMANCQSVTPTGNGQCEWDAQYWKYVPVTGAAGSYSFVQRQALRLYGVNRCLTASGSAAGSTFTIAMCGAAGPAGDPAVPLATQIFEFTP